VSNYTEFEKEFPSRCLALLRQHYASAQEADLECTLLLALTASSICAVADRIGLAAEKTGYPSSTPTAPRRVVRDRWHRHQEYFREPVSKLFGTASPPFWCEGVYTSKRRDPAEWEWRAVPDGYRVARLVSLLRNAFAHGNIWTLKIQGSDSIAEFVFAQRIGEPKENVELPLEAIRLTPSCLRNVMVDWATAMGGRDKSRRSGVTGDEAA